MGSRELNAIESYGQTQTDEKSSQEHTVKKKKLEVGVHLPPPSPTTSDMGCKASKLDNEDTVRWCKERRRLMKEAVYARHHLVVAQSDYYCSLKLTSSALISFAVGKLLSIAEEMPNVFIRTPSSTPTFKTPPLPTPVVRIPSPSPSIHQPPQLHYFVASQQQQPQEHGKNPVKLPHILSESSFPTTPRNHNFFENENYTYDAKANSTYSNTPSQASSVRYCEKIGLI
nr:nitrate regulatory gene2 protein-like [Ipomoea batatas]